MFPSLLPQTTRSTIKTAPKLDNFYNSVDSSAIPDMVAKYFPSSQKTEEYTLRPYGNASSLKLNSLNYRSSDIYFKLKSKENLKVGKSRGNNIFNQRPANVNKAVDDEKE